MELTKQIASDILELASTFISFDYEIDDLAINLPEDISSLPFDKWHLKALLRDNKHLFNYWSDMSGKEEDVVLPELKTFNVETSWRGREYVTRGYKLKVRGYGYDDIEEKLQLCEPCYYDGEEYFYDIVDADGEYDIDTVEPLTESDVKRIVRKIIK